MKSPKKGPMAMAVGTSLVAFIYIMVSLGLLLATNTGTITGLNQISPVIIFIMSLFICFSVMGVINGCVVYYIELTNNWIDDGSIVFAKLIKNKIAKQNVQATAYIMIINFFVFSAFTIIGCFYLNSYTGEYGSVQTERIYTLCDILSD
ncbi:hypothetical protein FACS189459_2790 [Bacilli bacterium]|nr:hypothetical protein FACS189459_2790 [Bacilli bacterium]GHU51748.1 hypothetical protein FACS189496_0640 [Bacilli bacterium]